MTIRASEITRAVVRIVNNPSVNSFDRRMLTYYHARELKDEEGEKAVDVFLGQCSREIVGSVLVQRAKLREQVELFKPISTFKKLLLAYISSFNNLGPETLNLLLPKLDLSKGKEDDSKKLLNDLYRELLALIDLEPVNDREEARELIEKIKAGEFNLVMLDKLEEFVAWAKRFNISLPKEEE